MTYFQQVSTSPTAHQGLTLGSQVLIIVTLLFGSGLLLLASGYISGKFMEQSDRSYWLGFAIGFIFVVVGPLLSFIVYLSSRRSTSRPAVPTPNPHLPALYNEDEPSPLELGSIVLTPIEEPEDLFARGADVCPACSSPVPVFMDACWNCGTLIHEEFIQTN